METREIETAIFCSYHDIDEPFLESLADVGLIEFKIIQRKKFIPHDQLSQIEKMVRMHRELDINIPGIQAVIDVLQKLEALRAENLTLQNSLRFYAEG